MSPGGTGNRVCVPYARQTLHNPNPVARFAHRRRHRLSLALATRHVAAGGAVLDFGAGTGVFLHELGALRPDLHLLAHEPFMELLFPEIRRIGDLGRLGNGTLAAVTAFEVCEHLAPSDLENFVGEARRLLGPDGRLILSVPLMEGLALPIKEVSRAILFRRASDYRAAELVRGMVGRPVPRPVNLQVSHKGFAHRELWRRLERDFTVVEASSSPLAALPWWMNSQRFGVFAPRG